MIRAEQIWHTIELHMPRDVWLGYPAIYSLIKDHNHLDREDYEPEEPGSNKPKWERNVRNKLQREKKKLHLDWDRRTVSYRLNSRRHKV